MGHRAGYYHRHRRGADRHDGKCRERGRGWSCTLGTLTCTSTAAIVAGAVGSPITLTATINSGVTAGTALTNGVAVSGGGETNTANYTASNLLTVVAPTQTITFDAIPNQILGGFAVPGGSEVEFRVGSELCVNDDHCL